MGAMSRQVDPRPPMSETLSHHHFSHLFLLDLPGSSFTLLLQLLLWILSSLELNVLFGDWSTFNGRRNKIAIPVALALLTRLRDSACQLVFGLVFMCGKMVEELEQGGSFGSKEEQEGHVHALTDSGDSLLEVQDWKEGRDMFQ